MKKIVSLVLIMVMLACFVSPVLAATTQESTSGGKVTIAMQNKNANIVVGNKVSVKVSLDNAKIKSVTYKSSKPNVATVNKSGVVTGKKAGTVKISAIVKDANNKTYNKSVKIYVKKAKTGKTPYATLSGVNTILKGNKTKFAAKLQNSKSSITKTTYKSSNKSIATVNSSGVISGKKVGSATITATSKTKDGHTLVATRKVNVKASKTSKTAYVTVSPTSQTLEVGKTKTLTVKLKNGGKDTIKSTKYSSSDTKIATVSSTGKITAKKAGTAKIKATVTTSKGQTLYATMKVTVKKQSWSSTVKPTGIKVQLITSRQNTNVEKVSGAAIKLSWNKISGADGYLVERSKKGSSEKQSLWFAEDTYFVDTNVRGDEDYTYYITPYKGSYFYGQGKPGGTTKVRAFDYGYRFEMVFYLINSCGLRFYRDTTNEWVPHALAHREQEGKYDSNTHDYEAVIVNTQSKTPEKDAVNFLIPRTFCVQNRDESLNQYGAGRCKIPNA